MKKSNPVPLPDRGQWVAVFFFICFGWIAYETFLLAGPFLPGVLGAAMLGILFSPLYRRILRRIRNPNSAAILLTIGIILLAVVPIIWLGWTAIKEAEFLRPTLAGFIENYRTPAFAQSHFGSIFHFFNGFQIDLKPLFLDEAAEIGGRMGSIGTLLAGHLITLLFNGIVLMLTLFFAFRDGKKGAEAVLLAVPISPQNKEALLKSVYGTFRAVVAGVFVTAASEGVADTVSFFAAGVPLPIFFGLAVAVFSLWGASVLITIPVAFWVMNRDTGLGIFILVWGILVALLSHNVLKPALIGAQSRMPFLLMLFSAFGGVKLYGFIGLFLGPMVVTAFLVFWDIYGKDYRLEGPRPFLGKPGFQKSEPEKSSKSTARISKR